VYHAAHEPAPLSRAAAALVAEALARVDADRDARTHRAVWYTAQLSGLPRVRLVQPLIGAEPGYLRFPILADAPGGQARDAQRSLGIVRTYPRPLGEEPAIAAMLHPREPSTPGAREICERLFTLPTHAAVRDPDAQRIVTWARASPGQARS
jgi:dTDP-4-amino-4,6-dideoxygalactose transaminase